MNALTKYVLLTLGFGKTDGGECRAILWKEGGAQVLAKFPLTICTMAGRRGLWHLPTDLKSFWVQKRKELADVSLNDIIAANGVNAVAGSAWGANLLLLGKENKPLAAVDYTSALQSVLVDRWMKAIDALWWHRTFNGAVKSPHQHLGVIGYMAENLSRETWEQCEAVVPVWDYLFSLGSGVQGHDEAQLQSWALSGNGPRSVENFFGAPLRHGMLCPWQTFGLDTVVNGPNDVRFIPFTHDTPMANTVGFATGAHYCVATGSWTMAAANIDGTSVALNETTCQLGLQFEGLRPRTVLKNIAMAGPTYKTMVQRAGMTYPQAAEAALSVKEPLPPIAPSAFQSRTAAEGVEYVLSRLELPAGQSAWPKALAVVNRSLAKGVADNLRQQEKVSGRPCNKVAVVGGFSENAAFLAALTQEGFVLVFPPQAAQATDIGVAAEAYRRLLKADGTVTTIKEVLEQMPKLEV